MISLIVAHDPNGLIGHKGRLPWHYKEDLVYFKKVTLGHTCLMGRVTFESILKTLKKPLPNRNNIVVSRQRLNYQGITVIHDLEAFLKANQETDEEIFVIGGALIYKMALPYAEKLYITKIHEVFKGDTYFPTYNADDFTLTFKEEKEALTFLIYERVVNNDR
ncbi:MAG: dihydrofolate reductase [Candidatus Izemoplasmataceae bacterium]